MISRKQRTETFADKPYTISICGRHVHVTDAMKVYAQEKLSKLEHYRGDRIVDIHVTMDIQRIDHRIDIVMKYGAALLKSHAVTTDMYASIDEAVDKIESQLKRYLGRIHDHHTEVPVTVYQRATFEEPPVLKDPTLVEEIAAITEPDEEEALATYNRAITADTSAFRSHQIVSTEKLPLKFLTDHEAIGEMEATSAPVMVFRGEEDHKIKVIYRRPDSNYGIIQPEVAA